MKTIKTLILLTLLTGLITACSNKKEQMKKELINFLSQHDSTLIPLSKEANLASWTASISGKPEDFKKAEDLQMQLVTIYANKESLKKLTDIKISGMITDT